MTVLNCVADVTSYDSKADYWDSFYLKVNSENMPEIQGPSQFAAFTLTEIQLLNITHLYEFAAGNGRDSIFFSQCNINVIATDKSDKAVSIIQRKNTNKFLKSEVHDIVRNSYSRKVFNDRSNIAVYARFFVHTLSENELFLFFRNLALMCLGGDRVFLEYRNNLDTLNHKVAPPHLRFFHKSSYVRSIAKKNGFEQSYECQGFGLAKFGVEDPNITRQIFSYSGV